MPAISPGRRRRLASDRFPRSREARTVEPLAVSGLELDLPLIARFPADGRTDALPDAGLVPDVVARPTAKDIAAGRDVALEAATRVAAK